MLGRNRPVVMGIVNVTPDSFSDGGAYFGRDRAVEHGMRLLEAGADVLDIGGESTRPGAPPVTFEQEHDRAIPVIAELARRCAGAVLSIDTCKSAVARAALDAGALIVNDVSAGRDAEMLPLVAQRGAVVVLMHMRGEPRTMQLDTAYDDVVGEVHGFLAARAAAALGIGIAREHVWLDPGIGFGKDLEGNLSLLAALPDLAALGHPVLLGASRKSFIGRLTDAPVDERLAGSLAALSAVCELPRVVVRVHDVAETVQFLTVLRAIRRAA